MSVYTATLTWKRGDQPFSDGKYSRGHEIAFDGGFSIPASSSPHVVRPPLSREDAADPEELFVAALSSCHALFFLDFARKAGFIVDSYVDAAEGVMSKRPGGKIAITKVTLKPVVAWSGDKRPSPAEISDLHHKSHDVCFIANSFNGEVVVEGMEVREDRETVLAALNHAVERRARADERLRALSNAEIEAAEDPIALQDMERDLDVLRHEINALDVEIAALEQKASDLGGPAV
ncbi:MAG: OsmC family protein [Hyphomonadaceae bacterium]